SDATRVVPGWPDIRRINRLAPTRTVPDRNVRMKTVGEGKESWSGRLRGFPKRRDEDGRNRGVAGHWTRATCPIRDRRARLRPRVEEAAAPQFERQQCPELELEIAAAGVLLQQTLDVVRPEHAALTRGVRQEHVTREAR